MQCHKTKFEIVIGMLPSLERHKVAKKLQKSIDNFQANYSSYNLSKYVKYDIELYGSLEDIDVRSKDVVIEFGLGIDSEGNDALDVITVEHCYNAVMPSHMSKIPINTFNLETWLSEFFDSTLSSNVYVITEKFADPIIAFRLPDALSFIERAFLSIEDYDYPQIIVGQKTIKRIPIHDVSERVIELGIILLDQSWITTDYQKLYLEEFHKEIIQSCLDDLEQESNIEYVHSFVYSITEEEWWG